MGEHPSTTQHGLQQPCVIIIHITYLNFLVLERGPLLVRCLYCSALSCIDSHHSRFPDSLPYLLPYSKINLVILSPRHVRNLLHTYTKSFFAQHAGRGGRRVYIDVFHQHWLSIGNQALWLGYGRPVAQRKNGSGDANGEQAIHCMMVSKIGSSVRIERFRERQ